MQAKLALATGRRSVESLWRASVERCFACGHQGAGCTGRRPGARIASRYRRRAAVFYQIAIKGRDELATAQRDNRG